MIQVHLRESKGCPVHGFSALQNHGPVYRSCLQVVEVEGIFIDSNGLRQSYTNICGKVSMPADDVFLELDYRPVTFHFLKPLNPLPLR